MASSGMVSFLSIAFPLPILSSSDNFKQIIFLVTSAIPQQLCWPHDLTYPEALRLTMLPSQAIKNFGYCGDHEIFFVFSVSASDLGALCQMYIKWRP